MKKFIADVNAPFEPRHVRTKINNERAKHEKEVQRRLKSMEMIQVFFKKMMSILLDY